MTDWLDRNLGPDLGRPVGVCPAEPADDHQHDWTFYLSPIQGDGSGLPPRSVSYWSCRDPNCRAVTIDNPTPSRDWQAANAPAWGWVG